jgi:hypothetical protein
VNWESPAVEVPGNNCSVTTIVAYAAENKNTRTSLKPVPKLLGCTAAGIFHKN